MGRREGPGPNWADTPRSGAIAREAAAFASGTASLDAALATLRRAVLRLELPPLRADRLL